MVKELKASQRKKSATPPVEHLSRDSHTNFAAFQQINQPPLRYEDGTVNQYLTHKAKNSQLSSCTHLIKSAEASIQSHKMNQTTRNIASKTSMNGFKLESSTKKL